MANRNLNARQQQKHDTSSNFNSKNATYLEGEILIESDTGRVKIADGDTDYKTLQYTIGTRVPTDAKFTDTTYTASGGLSLSGTTFSIANSGVAADTYGPTANVSGSWGTSFTVPSVVVNTKGQVTSAVDRTVTMPAKPTAADIGAEPAFTKNTAFNKNFGTASGTVCEGDDERLSNARPASDVSAWAKAATKPTYTPTEVGVIGAAPASGQVAVFDGTTGKIKSTGFTIATSVPANAEFTDTTYSVATVSEDGLIPKIPSSSAQYLNGMGQWSTPPDTKYTNFVGSGTGAKSGLVPSPGATAGTTRYLREDGTWYVPPDTTYRAGRAIEISQGAISVTNSGVSSGTYGLTTNTSVNVGTSFTVPGFVVDQHGRLTQAYSRAVTVNAPNMTGATTSEAGKAGFVPGPSAGDVYRYLRANGTWGAIPVVNSQRDGLAPKAPGDSRKFLNGSGNWATPYVADIGYDGYLPKLSGIPSTFLNGNGEWAVPPVFKGYTTGVAGTVGYVPAPTSANKFLKSDGTWADVGFSGGTVANDTTFSSNVTISGELNYDGGFY